MRASVKGVVAVALVLVAVAAGGGSSFADKSSDNCICRDMELTCEIRPTDALLVGEPYEVCTTVRNTGNYQLENIKVSMRLCEGSQVLEGSKLETVVPLLEVGKSFTHCARVVSYTVGDCRFMAHGVDDTQVAAAGCYCTAHISGLPALQVEMIDLDAQGQKQGIFRVGQEFIYRLQVEEDSGSTPVNQLQVEWTLPPQLEFIRGRGTGGTTVTGSGQSCQSSVFDLALGESRQFEIVCRVLSAPPGGLIQTEAVVRSAASGQQLAVETESSTLRK
jgi:hypothetical protein